MRQEVNPRVLVPLIAVIVIAGVAGILLLRSGGPDQAGGSADTSPTGETEPPAAGAEGDPDDDARTAWAVSANAICDGVLGELEETTIEISTSTEVTDQAILDAGEALVAANRRAIEDLRQLTAPPGSETEVARFLALLEQNVDAIDQFFTAVENEDPQELTAVLATGPATATQLAELARTLGADRCAAAAGSGPVDGSAVSSGADGAGGEVVAGEDPVSMRKLDRKLRKKGVVVMVVFSPSSAVDALIVREARAAASTTGAAFLAIDGTDEAEAGALAREYELRSTPTVVVFSAGPTVETRLVGFADRETIAQAAENALSAAALAQTS
ncbi:MAG: hypothetical protein ACE5EV_06095 [Gaiellales bacterium]